MCDALIGVFLDPDSKLYKNFDAGKVGDAENVAKGLQNALLNS